MTCRQKAEKILLLLPRKTTSSFDAEKILMECIIWTGQLVLAKKIGYSDPELKEISDNNPSPTIPVPDSKYICEVSLSSGLHPQIVPLQLRIL